MANQPSANPTYKLTYFNAKALGEPIRILFAYGGIEFEDIRLEKENWLPFKANMPMGQLPVLDIDGVVVYQSIAITRYIAHKVGLVGSNDWENLLIDSVVDTVNEFRAKIRDAYYESDAVIKQKRYDELKNDVIQFYLEKLDATAEAGYLALGKLTWADVFFVGLIDYLNFCIGSELTDNFPNLKKVITNVSNVPLIRAWLDERPKTDL